MAIDYETVVASTPQYVHEFEKGWSFDGKYIPHFLELNWYFGENPVDYRELHSVRVHGLSKGIVGIGVASNGMQTDYYEDYSESQHIDLPNNFNVDIHPVNITEGYLPVTAYAEPLNRGISIQLKFEGRNEDLEKPEPSHVLQVLVTESSPVGNGNRSN